VQIGVSSHRFQYDELTENMRQSGDMIYSTMLSHIRVGNLTTEEEQILIERMIAGGERRATVNKICTRYRQLDGENKEPIMLVPRTSQCDELNSAMLKEMEQDIYNLSAVDILDTIVTQNYMAKVNKAYDKVKDDVTRTAGLERSLQLCVGAKVMLKRYKNVEAGLVNGSVGVVTGFTSQNSKVSSVEVEFNKVPGTVKIERESASFEILKGIFYTRKQFPLMPAFAITVHRCQALSLQSAIVDAGSTCFGPGMVYVALSRVTSLSGLHLIDFQKSRIQCDKDAIREYNRHRHLYTPQLGQLPVPTVSRKRSKHTQQDAETTLESEELPLPTASQKRCKQGTQEDAETTLEADHTLSKTTDNLPPYIDATGGTLVVNHPAPVTSIFQHCNVYSVDSMYQTSTCLRLNLQLCPDDVTVRSLSSPAVARRMAGDIYKHTGTRTSVNIYRVSGTDGNCLFRALSLGITRTQSQHELLSSYLVNYMLHGSIKDDLRNIYMGSDEEYNNHLLKMQESGEWGTDCEIVAAAHMLEISILCYSQYDTFGQYRFQQFSPHFLLTRDCTYECNHETLYLINTSGSHYELATVTPLPILEE